MHKYRPPRVLSFLICKNLYNYLESIATKICDQSFIKIHTNRGKSIYVKGCIFLLLKKVFLISSSFQIYFEKFILKNNLYYLH